MTFDDAKSWLQNCMFQLSEGKITEEKAMEEFKDTMRKYGLFGA